MGIPDERDQRFWHRDQSFRRNVTAHSGRT